MNTVVLQLALKERQLSRKGVKEEVKFSGYNFPKWTSISCLQQLGETGGMCLYYSVHVQVNVCTKFSVYLLVD